ncbi:MAG: hypothetical protein NZ821_06820, partial [Gloeomargarita sp. SKYB31]|nr:hypothetical protein [Gloeomargarita sp. SKYB31]
MSCALAAPVTSAPVTITQNPDLVSVRTGTFNPGGNPVNPTAFNTVAPPAPATLAPSTTIPAANVAGTTTACQYDATNGYGQEYIYAIPEASAAVSTANSNDYFDWTVSGVANTIVAGGDGIGSRFVRVRWTGTGTGTVGVEQQNNQAPATGSGPFTGSCNTTMTSLSVTVNPIPAAFTASQYQWQGAASGASHEACENQTINITISGLASGTQVQLYQINQVANSGGVGFGYTNPTTLPSPIQTAGGAGTVTFTINTGSITPGTILPAWQDITVQFVTVNQNNCGRTTGLVSPVLRVWDTPANPVATGPTPVCPNKITHPNALINAAG